MQVRDGSPNDLPERLATKVPDVVWMLFPCIAHVGDGAD